MDVLLIVKALFSGRSGIFLIFYWSYVVVHNPRSSTIGTTTTQILHHLQELSNVPYNKSKECIQQYLPAFYITSTAQEMILNQMV